MGPMLIHGRNARFTRSELDELKRLAEAHGLELPEEPRTIEEAFAAILCAMGPDAIRRFCELAGIDPDEVLPQEPAPPTPPGS